MVGMGEGVGRDSGWYVPGRRRGQISAAGSVPPSVGIPSPIVSLIAEKNWIATAPR